MPLPPLTSMECTVTDGLARVVLNQPDRGNPIDGAFCRELNALATELSDRADVRAVLLSARGKYFSVGGDIKAFSRERDKLSSIVKSWTGDLHLAIARLMRMRAPVDRGGSGRRRRRERLARCVGRHRLCRNRRSLFRRVPGDRFQRRQRLDGHVVAAHGVRAGQALPAAGGIA